MLSDDILRFVFLYDARFEKSIKIKIHQQAIKTLLKSSNPKTGTNQNSFQKFSCNIHDTALIADINTSIFESKILEQSLVIINSYF